MASSRASVAPRPLEGPQKPNFWRIRNIDINERELAEEWLCRQAQEAGLPKGVGYSLAADSERTLSATVTSYSHPSPSQLAWFVDEEFDGLTPLYDREDANVDIVAITGLDGHALGSFRSDDGGSVWLRDFAPEDIPQARWMTYGYDSAVFGSENHSGIREYADTCLRSLVRFRQRTNTTDRPLCFLCHNIGGIVLKEVLIKSSKAIEDGDDELGQILRVTHGLLFMGVPNLGLRHQQLVSVVQGKPNERLIRDLVVGKEQEEPSQFLELLNEAFERLDRQRRPPFEIMSYYETRSSPTAMVRTLRIGD